MACAYCVQRQPILDLQQLHIGDHIEFGRISAIKTFLRGIDLCPSITEHLRFGYLYFHHAIVIEINHIERKIKFVEFASEESTLPKFLRSLRKPVIMESVMNFNENQQDMDMFLVIHKNRGNNPPSPQEIVKNARRLLQEAKSERYNLMFNNCEHLANMCVTQHRVSLQILQVRESTERLLQRIITNRPSWFKKLEGTLSRKLISLLKRLETVLKSMKSQKLFSAYENIKRFTGKWMACTLAIAVTFLALDIYQFYSACKDNGLCDHCFERWVAKIVGRLLSMLFSTNFVLLGAFACCFTGFLAYKRLFSNPKYTDPLKSLKGVEPGNVICFNLHMPFSFHDVIVVSLARQFAAGYIKSLETSFSSMSEQEVFDLLKLLTEEFFRHERHPSIRYVDISVQDNSGKKARKPRGSNFYRKMNDFLETSPCLKLEKNGRGQWCQVILERTDEENQDRPRIHFLVDDEHIRLYHNLYKIYQVEIIHYDLEKGLRFPDVLFASSRVVKSEVKTLDLENKHTVYKKIFAEDSKAYRNQPGVIVQKAVEKIGERRWGLFGRWSSDVAGECVLVDRETYYSRGERFARIVHANSFDLLYAELMAGGTCSSLSFIDYVMGLLTSSKKK